MKVTIAIDSFKGSLSTFQSGSAVKKAIMDQYSSAEVVVCPIADGGEGTVDALVSALNGEYKNVQVCGPLGDSVMATYGIVEGNTAVIEMSAAAGITLIDESMRNPLFTTTYGVGEMIRDAIGVGCRKFIVGIGGSATNDGGVGMLSALGYKFLDSNGNEIPRGSYGLKSLSQIDFNDVISSLSECEFYVACDVTNPLCGPNGCSNIYGPQKGATPQMIADMDSWLMKYAEITGQYNRKSDSEFKGAGAAGGMGFAFMSYLNSQLVPGIDLIMEHTNLEHHIEQSDIVITGEGRLDGQSCMGKAPVGVAKLAKKYNKSVIAFSGVVSDDAEMCNSCGIDAFFPILRDICSVQEAMNCDVAYKNLYSSAKQVFALLKTFEYMK